MNSSYTRALIYVPVLGCLALSSCVNSPTLEGMSRQRAYLSTAGANKSVDATGDLSIAYTITDRDVLNFTEAVGKKVHARATLHTSVRYSSATLEVSLGALAGAAKTFGWGVRTASGLGLGSAYVFGMGQIFDSKGHAQAYDQAYEAIDAAKSKFLFHRLGMTVKTDPTTGKKQIDSLFPQGRGDIPSSEVLTPDGELLYYRVTKILKVLQDTLASKIPDLQDLKDANGEPADASSPPKPQTDAKAKRPQTGGGGGGGGGGTSTTTTTTTTSTGTGAGVQTPPPPAADPAHDTQKALASRVKGLSDDKALKLSNDYVGFIDKNGKPVDGITKENAKRKLLVIISRLSDAKLNELQTDFDKP